MANTLQKPTIAGWVAHLLAGFNLGLLAHGLIIIAVELTMPGNHVGGDRQVVNTKQTIEVATMSAPFIFGIIGCLVARKNPLANFNSWWVAVALAMTGCVLTLADLFILFLVSMSGYC
ncbi:hypothetical protein EON80_01615 [bacterium]|nr:MAG: hypothetical protein EON80_01615 [bacterium]